MRLSLFSDYSLRVLMYAAAKADSFSISEVASAFNISRHHLVKVVNQLAHLGYLQTRRGRGGGITLGPAADSIRIGHVIRQTETDQPLVECFDSATSRCAVNGHCMLKGILGQAQNAFYQTLDRYTLADLATETRGRQLLKALISLPS
jgi:Rrf2 family transcriptional regulator, nitric oxide-sensitive transcriptional repressor